MRPIQELLDAQALPDGEGDKRDNGSLVIVGAPPMCPGAVVLAAEAALRMGCGRVQLAVDPSVAVSIGVAVPEAAVFPWLQSSSPPASVADRLAKANAIVVGPGHSRLDEVVVRSIAERTDAVLILDAGALAASFTLTRTNPVLIAPNPAEAARLVGGEEDEEQLARALADRMSGPVAVRGAVTVIADKDECWCFDNAPEGLGTPGSGDVFMGILGALAAAGVEALAALALATTIHADAGRNLASSTPVGYLARDIVKEIPFARAAMRSA